MFQWRTTAISKLIAILLLGLLLLGCTASPTKRSTRDFLDDTAILAKIKSNLIFDPMVESDDVTVVVELGNVQLLGFVDNHQQRLRAEEIAKGSEGVFSLENSLMVVRGPRRLGQYVDDKVLAGRVHSALVDSGSFRSDRINVLVNRDIVLLGGFVNDEHERQLAARIARYVEGVINVYNEILVRSE